MQTSQMPLHSVAADYLVQSQRTVVHRLPWEQLTERRNWQCLPWRPIHEIILIILIIVVVDDDDDENERTV